ncbi:MAG TPA: hypothetical protein DCM05_02460 [Elusimicrobia bacterium]|nr:hypothetical protein [Elusimicrobiota bacterium]
MKDEEIFALLRQDTAKEKPPAPPIARYLAWGFFGLLIFWMIVMSLFLVNKGKNIQRKPILPRPRPGDTGPPRIEPPVFQSVTVDETGGR